MSGGWAPRRNGASAKRLAAAACCVVATLSYACAPRPSAPAVEGVILVDLDTVRADCLSSYGNPRPTSPHLDAFAASGTRFDWAFAQAPYTLPSQVSIVTSLYPHTHGVILEKDRMAPAALTLAEIFRAQGWRTAAFVDGGYVSRPFGFDQGFETFEDFDRGGLARSEGAIAKWLEQHAREKFFLLVHTYDAHAPYAPPEPFRSRFAALAPPPTPGFEPTSDALEAIRASQWTPPQRALAPNDLAFARALYDGEVAFIDSWFGRLLDELRRLGLADRVLIGVVSDHGEEFQEHGSVLHEKLYASVTRVPMLVRAPGGRSGQVVSEAVETIDLMPTLLELAGLEPPPTLEGRSLRDTVLAGRHPAPRDGLAHSPFWGDQRALVSGDYHLILTMNSARLELYRYREDAAEARDLAASERAEAEKLVRAMRQRVATLDATGGIRAGATLPPETEASLRALGYLR